MSNTVENKALQIEREMMTLVDIEEVLVDFLDTYKQEVMTGHAPHDRVVEDFAEVMLKRLKDSGKLKAA